MCICLRICLRICVLALLALVAGCSKTDEQIALSARLAREEREEQEKLQRVRAETRANEEKSLLAKSTEAFNEWQKKRAAEEEIREQTRKKWAADARQARKNEIDQREKADKLEASLPVELETIKQKYRNDGDKLRYEIGQLKTQWLHEKNPDKKAEIDEVGRKKVDELDLLPARLNAELEAKRVQVQASSRRIREGLD